MTIEILIHCHCQLLKREATINCRTVDINEPFFRYKTKAVSFPVYVIEDVRFEYAVSDEVEHSSSIWRLLIESGKLQWDKKIKAEFDGREMTLREYGERKRMEVL